MQPDANMESLVCNCRYIEKRDGSLVPFNASKIIAAIHKAGTATGDFTDEETGSYEFDGSMLKEAHEWCQESVECAMDRNENIVVSNTFTKKWEMQAYFDMAEKYGYKVKVFRCVGEYKNTHDVPAHVVERMKENYEPLANERKI